jgi:arabinose-5-phosphate isomerase
MKIRQVNNSAIEIGKRVLDIEEAAVRHLKKFINRSFEHAVEMLYNCKGRIMVTGMGKAGIIGRKIAATFASTGSPAYFVHPEEALHGDLGMIVKNDVVLSLSNSGETEELLRVITVIKKIGAKIISMTGDEDSSLAQYSDIVLNVSVHREACPMNLVPTASCIAALAMGDALAIALLERRGFSPEDYAFYHPGGSIGKRLLTIKHIMRKKDKSPVILMDKTVLETLNCISAAGAGTAAIVNSKGVLAGVFSDGDFRRTMQKDKDALEKKISAFMTKDPKTVFSDTLVAEALRTIKEKSVGTLVVVDKKHRPIGIVDERDLLGLA